MAKQDVLDAINATIVENGQKGITAQALNNVLTMMAENAGEGGTGDGALRVMIPVDIAGATEMDFTPEYWNQGGPVLDVVLPGVYAELDPIVQEMFRHNAEVYAQLMVKANNAEGVMCLVDCSAYFKPVLQAVIGSMGVEVSIDGLSISLPVMAKIADSQAPEITEELGLSQGVTLTIPSIENLFEYDTVELRADGSVKLSIAEYNHINIPSPETSYTLSDEDKAENLKVVKHAYDISAPLKVRYVSVKTGEDISEVITPNIVACNTKGYIYRFFYGLNLMEATIDPDTGDVTTAVIGSLSSNPQ